MAHSKSLVGLVALLLIAGCGSSDSNPGTGDHGGSSGAATMGGNGGASGSTSAGSGGVAGASAGVGGSAGSAGSAGVAGGATAVACAPPADVFSPITTLSQTGCVDPADPRKPIASAVAYEVNSPLWSDSADKARAFVLPAGGKIHVRECTANASDCPMGTQDDGRWDFPVGTVMIKIFMFDDKLVETRLFMHLDADNWIGYSYEWDEEQTDAKIVSADRVSVMFNTGTRTVPWHYPSQDDCITCHNKAEGSTIGPETAQMNRTVGGMNQIDKFTALDLFETPPPKPYKAALVTPYTGQAGTAPANPTPEETTAEARSYLHANCGFCHRPGGAFALFDLRYDTLLKDTNICNVTINKAPLASAPDKNLILSPGKPMDSVLWLRMNLADPVAGRMPQIASYAVDTNAVGVVGDWITALKVADCTQ